MEEKNIQIENHSNDRKYFTMIPNIVLDNSSAQQQALYIQLKRLAGKDGLAYCGSRYLQKQLKVTHNTIRKLFDFLLKKGWIKYMGEKEILTDGGPQNVKSYGIVDIWEENLKEYQINNTLNAKGVSNKQQPPIKITTKEEHTKNIGYSAAVAARAEKGKKNAERSNEIIKNYNFDEYLKTMEDDPRRHIQVIAFYFKKKKLRFKTLQEVQSAIRRHLRAAREVANFDDDAIVNAYKKADREYPNLYTVETLLKVLTR